MKSLQEKLKLESKQRWKEFKKREEEASRASIYEEWDNEQAMMELAKEEEIEINAIPLATKVPVVGFKIHTRGKPGYYEIFRADGSSKLYHVFSELLSEFDKEDLVNLGKLVKAKHGDNRPEEDFERVL
ncbi:hypothetical protein Tco_0067567 [Tanacetum coccineum]